MFMINIVNISMNNIKHIVRGPAHANVSVAFDRNFFLYYLQ